MIKKIIVLIFVFLLCMLLGDTNPDILRYQCVLSGENDSWNVIYAQYGAGWFTQTPNGLHYDSYGNDVLTITYKKDPSALEAVKHFKISYNIGSGAGSLEGDDIVSLFFKRNYTFRNINSLPVQKSTARTVTIELDGETQTIELKSNPLYQMITVFYDIHRPYKIGV